ncbi:hypothetical protein EDB89DRAFT_1914798 [Lactarius sanguifluus]|nr:hypothetical protein EDB89DRAFT_1914798 [Lactarius sanguifluus]
MTGDGLDDFLAEHGNYYGTINCLMPVLYGLLHTPQLPIMPYHVRQLLDFVRTSQGYIDLTSVGCEACVCIIVRILGILCKIVGAEVIVIPVPGTGSIALHEIRPTGITTMPHAPLDVFHPLVTRGRTPTTASLPSVSVFHVVDDTLTGLIFIPPSARRTRRATTKAAPGTTIDSGNTPSPDEHPSTKGPDAKVDKGLGPAVDSDSKKAPSRRRGKAKRGMGFGYGNSGPTDNRVAPNGGGPSTQVKAVVLTRALPSQPKQPRRNKEQIEADRKAAEKALEEKLHDVRMAKERLVEADNGSNPDDSSSESDEATKMKTKSRNKRVEGAARPELLTRTEDLRGTKHTEETRRQQKSTHDMGDLRCKKYANSGLRLQAPSLTPPNAALIPTLLQQPDVTDPLKLGGLGDSDLEETCPVIAGNSVSGKPQATRKPPSHKSKAVKAIVKKDGKCFTEAQPDTHPDIARQCLDDSHWTRIFLPTLSHTLYISDHPFTDWTRESSALVETVVTFELSFTNISYTLSAQDGIVKATRRSKIARDVLMLVKTFFERAEFKDQPEKIKDYVYWALKSGGPAYYENPVPKSSKLRKDDPNYTVERAMRAHLMGRFNAPRDFNHQTSWNAMKDFNRILDQVTPQSLGFSTPILRSFQSRSGTLEDRPCVLAPRAVLCPSLLVFYCIAHPFQLSAILKTPLEAARSVALTIGGFILSHYMARMFNPVFLAQKCVVFPPSHLFYLLRNLSLSPACRSGTPTQNTRRCPAATATDGIISFGFVFPALRVGLAPVPASLNSLRLGSIQHI